MSNGVCGAVSCQKQNFAVYSYPVCKEAMSENGFLQVLQALNSLNFFRLYRFYRTSGLFEGLLEEVTGNEVADSDVTV